MLSQEPLPCRLITDAGRKRFLEYITVLESVVTDALTAPEAGVVSTPNPKLEGLNPA